jgi:hypothetical protein
VVTSCAGGVACLERTKWEPASPARWNRRPTAGPQTVPGQRIAAIAENNRIKLVLLGMQNRTSGPILATMHRILISVISGSSQTAPGRSWGCMVGFEVGRRFWGPTIHRSRRRSN